MKQFYFFLIAIILFSSTSYAQAPQYHWMNQLGGTGADGAGYVSIDSKGNVISIADIASTAYFKPKSSKEIIFTKSTSSTTKHLIITKVNSLGNLLWVKQIEDILGTTSITIDKNDNIIIAGFYNNSKDFDPGIGVFNLTAKAGADIFILKLDEKGTFLWAGSIGSKNGEQPYSIVTDKNNNIALICEFRDTLDVDMSSAIFNLIPTSSIERAVLKLDSNGKFLWAHHLKDINPNALTFDSSGNLYSTGYFLGTKDFDYGTGIFNMTTTGAITSGDCYVLKEDTAGKFLWAKSFGEFINRDNPMCIFVDNSQNVLIAGNCGAGNSDFDPGPGVVNLVGNSEFILKLNKTGDYIWVKGINGGIYPFDFVSIGVNMDNQVYTYGHFDDKVDFDPSLGVSFLTPLASRDGFILKLDSNGIFDWVNQLNCTGTLSARNMVIGSNSSLYLGGIFTSKVDFDPSVSLKVDSSVGSNDVFTLKLSRCLLNNSISLNECKYFNYAGYRFDSSEKVDFLFTSVAGCDSVVTVDMAIKKVNDTISVSGSVVNAKSSSASAYQWVNCPSYSPVIGATTSSFTATNSGSYALIITENGCTDTSACVSVVGLSIQEAQQSEAISISPNPSKGMFNLSLPSEIKGQLEVKSIDGKILYSELISSTKLTIDLSNYASGLYILNVTDNKGKKIVEKLMKY